MTENSTEGRQSAADVKPETTPEANPEAQPELNSEAHSREFTPSRPSAVEAASAEKPEVSWQDLGLSQGSLALLEKAGFVRPTSIQSESIPLALDGHDLIASAQTGTGKTASFVLPMVERFAGKEGTFGLILAPTREIAQQIQTTLELFAHPQGLRSIVLIGGIDMKIDAQALQTYPQIIVATPGRLCDHLDRGNLWLDFIQMVVLDEADRMLDMGFADQLSRIMQEVPSDRQTLIFSATFPPTVERLASKVLYEPQRIAIGKPTVANASVEQRFRQVSEDSKPRELMRLLRQESGTIIVFARSKDGATRLWRWLHSHGVYDATFIHSDRTQADRELALKEFRAGKYRILIATDVAARGIHVDNVAHVINYDLPMEPEDYIHRIGRTGRQGATGVATTLVTPRDRRQIQAIEKLLGRNFGLRDEGRGGAADGDRGDSGRGRPRPASSGEAGRTGDGTKRRRRRRSGSPQGGGDHRQVAGAPSGEASAVPLAADAQVGGDASAATKKRRRRRRRGKKPGAAGASESGSSSPAQ